jgi:aminopeptidase N
MHRSLSSRARAVAVLAAVAALAAGAAPAGAHSHAPRPGAVGIGDPLFPTLGNGGYDALHYTLSLRYATATPLQTVSGTVTMVARSTQALSRFNLDFAGDSVKAVWVNGRPARFSWTQASEELSITPSRPIRDRDKFVATVSYTAHTRDQTPADQNLPFGWFTVNGTPGNPTVGSVTAGQPDFGHEIYPVNDHPADKASYLINFDVPEGTTAVANGDLVFRRSHGGRTFSSYFMREPMASELIQLAVGQFDVQTQPSTRGVRVRDVVSSNVAAAAKPALARTPAHLNWMIDRVGRYPFNAYGVLAADELFFYALETQTLSLHPAFLVTPPAPPSFYEPVMVHELAHQWFGDSVAPVRWQDVWLNEGHADWYQQLYTVEFFGLDLDEYMKAAYERGNTLRAQYGPVAKPTGNDIFTLFSPNVYEGGSLVLFALRQVVGERTFSEIERTWVARYKDQSVSTEQFIAHVNRVSHRNLTTFLRHWLYDSTIPPMPGHPDWTSPPAPATATTSAARSAALPNARALELGIYKR